jgi:hypothetical protein
MTHRNTEVLEAIRRDDLAFLMSTRYEAILDCLLASDTPEMLREPCTALMVAAYFGAVRCFYFLVKRSNVEVRTAVCLGVTKSLYNFSLVCFLVMMSLFFSKTLHSFRCCWW